MNRLFQLTILFLVLFISPSLAQSDSSSNHFSFGLRGRKQTGNVNQLGLNPSLDFGFSRGVSQTLLSANYDFLRINGNQVVSDLWLSGLFKGNSSKKVYTIARAFYGFAKSYRIDQSFMGGLGIGTILRSESGPEFIEFNAFAGYMDIDYDDGANHSAPALGILIKASIPIVKDKLSLSWQLDTYNSMNDVGFWGLSNRTTLVYPLLKRISLNVIHTTIFNNVVSDTIQRTNTLMLFGFTYHNN